METSKKLALLEEMMEIDEGMLAANTKLGDIKEYDSMAKLSLIVLMNEEFGKKLTANQIKTFQTVQDVLDFMG